MPQVNGNNNQNEIPLVLVSIFDDSLWRVISNALKGKFRVRREIDGLRAIDVALLLRPAAIIAETGLPGLSGILLARLIGNNRYLSRLPVALIMSREFLIEDFWAKESGADVIVQKEDAMEAVRKIEFAIVHRVPISDEDWEEAEHTIMAHGGPAAGVANELERQLIGASIIGHLGEIEISSEGTSIQSAIPTFCGKALGALASVVEFAQVGIVLFETSQLYIVENEIYTDSLDLDSFITESRNASELYTDSIPSVKSLEIINLPSVSHKLPGQREPASTYFALPLTGRSGNYGLLSIMTYKQIAVRDYYLHTLSLIGKQMSVTLERALFYEEVRRLSVTDTVTTLSNRRAIIQRLEDEYRRSSRYKVPFSVAIADLDDFKRINDTYGHHAGDEVLKAVSLIMKQSVREVDLAGRWGGEEIALLFPQTDLDGAIVACERLRVQIENNITNYQGKNLKITVSIGVATINPDENIVKSSEDLVGLADSAMYLAKNAGKNRVASYIELPAIKKQIENRAVKSTGD